MQTREGPDFWGLLKSTNCAFPLNYVDFGSILEAFLSLQMTKLKKLKMRKYRNDRYGYVVLNI